MGRQIIVCAHAAMQTFAVAVTLLAVIALQANASPLKFDHSVFTAEQAHVDAPLRRYSSGSAQATGVTASTYVGDTKLMYELSHGQSIGIYDSKTKKWADGCKVASAVTSRRGVSVAFTAEVTAAKAA